MKSKVHYQVLELVNRRLVCLPRGAAWHWEGTQWRRVPFPFYEWPENVEYGGMKPHAVRFLSTAARLPSTRPLVHAYRQSRIWVSCLLEDDDMVWIVAAPTQRGGEVLSPGHDLAVFHLSFLEAQPPASVVLHIAMG